MALNLIQLYNFLRHSLLAPFECLCGNFILPEPASYVFFYAVFNLRNLLYLIKGGEQEWISRRCIFYDKRNDVVFETFREHDKPSNAAAAILKWVDTLKAHMKIQNIVQSTRNGT